MSLCKNFALHEKMKNRELQKKLRSDLKSAPPNFVKTSVYINATNFLLTSVIMV